MTFSLPVVLILATCLVLPAVAITGTCGLLATSPLESRPEIMKETVKGLRADVQDLDVDARKTGWRRERWGGSTAYVQARIMDASREVMVLTPYAETSVTVGLSEDATERRWCSLCLN